MPSEILKVLFWGVLGFIFAILLTPLLSGFLYKHKLWRKSVRELTPDGYVPVEFQKLHKEREVRVPRMGGLLIWVSVAIFAALSLAVSHFSISPIVSGLNFVSRNQTWLPLFSLIAASLLGLLDDLMQVLGYGKYAGGGMRFSRRLIIILGIAAISAWWFYFRLEQHSIYIPGFHDIDIGFWFIPFFIIMMLGVFSGGVVDGLDGLAGGVFATIFGAYGVIAFAQNQYDVAAFCALLVGTILAFLWFNIPPARFYMGETGILGLTVTLTVIAFLTHAVVVLPVIGFILVAESFSVILQLLSKKLRHGKKIFKVAPIHHHFEAIGWPAEKVTMRFWVISAVAAVFGVLIQLFSQTIKF